MFGKFFGRVGLLLGLLSTFVFTSQLSLADAEYVFDKRRVGPGYFDPGPEKGSPLAKLYGQAPNYRAIGRYILGGFDRDKYLQGRSGKFRWMFGPMWYRGRLGKEEVKMFVVGQEGAQDENVSNRAFTGSTGTKTQKFLNHLGIWKSYLFMNTFVYTINGQLSHGDKRFKWMEQGAEKGAESPLVLYRHELFDQMLIQNKNTLQVILGVGSGGKASVATWINARGGKCSPSNNLANCKIDAGTMRAYFKKNHKVDLPRDLDLLVIGVPHPGGASPSNGGAAALKNIIRGFTKAARTVKKKMADDKDFASKWFKNLDELEGVSGRDRDKKKKAIIARWQPDYRYGNAPVPFYDFAYGTNWRMGATGTTSNRRKADSIQVFSKAGKYNNKGHNVSYKRPKENRSGIKKLRNGVYTIAQMLDFDLAYEMPRFKFFGLDYSIPKADRLYKGNNAQIDLYDYGPCGTRRNSCRISKLLQAWPDFADLGVTQPKNHASFGHGPTYRGRFKDAQVIVLADQMSHDDFFSGRALTGSAGQHLQKFLEVAGAGDDYVIVRTLPIDTLGMSEAKVKEIANADKVVETREAILQYAWDNAADGAVVVTLGEVAKDLAASRHGFGEDVVANLPAPGSRGWVAAWKKAAQAVAEKINGGDLEGTFSSKQMIISRSDLPAHTRWWMGTSGSRAARGDGDAKVVGNYYKVWAPQWVPSLKPVKLTKAEMDEIDRLWENSEESGRSGDAEKDEANYRHPQYNQDDKQFHQSEEAEEKTEVPAIQTAQYNFEDIVEENASQQINVQIAQQVQQVQQIPEEEESAAQNQEAPTPIPAELQAALSDARVQQQIQTAGMSIQQVVQLNEQHAGRSGDAEAQQQIIQTEQNPAQQHSDDDVDQDPVEIVEADE